MAVVRAARKTTATKEEPAKKTVVSKPASKNAEPPKKTAARKPAKAADPLAELVSTVTAMIKNGELDLHMVDIDAAVVSRLDAQAAVVAAAAKTVDKPASKSPATQNKLPAVSRAKSASATPAVNKRVTVPAVVVPVVGTVYGIDPKLKKLDGAKVKFIGFRQNDETKAIVEVTVEVPGAPKGKKIAVPVAALKKITTTRRAAKK